MHNAPILVIGSSGKTGRRVAAGLARKGLEVREGSRRAETPFDWDDRTTWRPALHAVRAAYIAYAPDLAAPGALDNLNALIEIAREEGVGRLVLLSGRGEANARKGEQAVLESGIPSTVVRAAWFNQNFTEGHMAGVVPEGVLAVPAGDVKEAIVDADDIADVAIAALTEDGHAGEIYEVTGPELLSFHEIAAQLSESSGHQVTYLPISFEENKAALVEAVGPELGSLINDIMTETLSGENEFVGDGVERALGRKAKPFRQYCEEAKAAGAWDQLAASPEGGA